MPGPVPKPAAERRRRNEPTIPSTKLPIGGREGRAPTCPYKLGRTGMKWWRWAWRTPEAAAWDALGHSFTVARRAQLEDDLETVTSLAVEFDLAELVAAAGGTPIDDEALADALDAAGKITKAVVDRLLGLAGGKLAILREMRELDDRLGLSPKAMAQLRWEIVHDQTTLASVTGMAPKASRRKAVDPGAVAGS